MAGPENVAGADQTDANASVIHPMQSRFGCEKPRRLAGVLIPDPRMLCQSVEGFLPASAPFSLASIAVRVEEFQAYCLTRNG
jgi:hypothetical protein